MDAISFASNLILCTLVLLSVYQDFTTNKVSNRLILFGYGFALGLILLQGNLANIAQFLWGIAFPVILLFPFFIIRILGAGDIKLLSMIGGFVKLNELLWCMGLSFAIGAVISLILLLERGIMLAALKDGASFLGSMMWKGSLEEYEKREDQKHLMHFSLAICLALAIVKGVIKA